MLRDVGKFYMGVGLAMTQFVIGPDLVNRANKYKALGPRRLWHYLDSGEKKIYAAHWGMLLSSIPILVLSVLMLTAGLLSYSVMFLLLGFTGTAVTGRIGISVETDYQAKYFQQYLADKSA